MRTTRLFPAGAAGLTLLLAACGVNPGEFKARDSEGCHDKVVPPKGYYDALMAEKVQKLGLAAASAPKTLYINFDGGMIEKGFKRGQSFIACSALSNLPESGLSPADRDEIVSRVSVHFETAGVELSVTATAPISGDYTTMYVGGSYGSLGCTDTQSTLGIAPFDDGNQNLNDIGFTFTKYETNIGVIADTVAHEAGHTFGLDHTVNVKDLMHPSAQGNDLEFAISQVVNGTDMQDGPAMLRRNVGTKPGFADPSGSNNATVPGNVNNGSSSGGGSISGGGLFSGISTLGGLLGQIQPNQIMNIMTLLPGFASMIPGMSNGTTAAFPGGNYMAVLGALPGIDKINSMVSMAAPGFAGAASAAGFNPASIASMAALAAFGGYASIPAAMMGAQSSLAPLMAMIMQMLGMNLSGQGALPDPTQIANQLPSYVNAYNLGSVATAPALLSAMGQQSSFITANYTGANQAALLSGLKVAAAQAYVLMNL